MIIKYNGYKLELCWNFHSDGDPYLECVYLEDVTNGPNLINLISDELIVKFEDTYKERARYEREQELKALEDESSYERQAGK